MVDVLISLIIIMVVFGLLYWLITLLPLPDPAKTIINVAFIIICILIVLSMFTGMVDFSHYHLRK